MDYFKNVINFLLSFKKQISYLILLLTTFWLMSTLIESFKPVGKVEIKQNLGVKADYSSDLSFLECISQQHSCIYENIRTNNSDFIIENCGEEQACIVNKGKK